MINLIFKIVFYFLFYFFKKETIYITAIFLILQKFKLKTNILIKLNTVNKFLMKLEMWSRKIWKIYVHGNMQMEAMPVW